MEPVDPRMEIGFRPSHFLYPGGTTACPGQAGGGGCEEQWILLWTIVLQSLMDDPPENKKA